MTQSLAARADQILREIYGDKPKRARCEENWAELVVAVVFSDSSVVTKSDILQHAVAQSHPGYVVDLSKRDAAMVQGYIANLKSEIQNLQLPVKEVYILGKNQKVTPEITKLQKGLDRKAKKADVMLLLTDGTYVGISVKSGKGDTLTNYAIEKFLTNGKELATLRLNMIQEAGLPLALDKNRRNEYNDLFRGENAYHSELITSVVENKQSVLEQWSKNLFAETPFDIYSFDGEKLRPNTYNQIKESEFDIRPIPNPAKNARGAAKTFFEVSENGVPAYIWDVRWKGSVFASPQIFTYRIH